MTWIVSFGTILISSSLLRTQLLSLSPHCFPSLSRQDITTPAHPLRIHTRQERTQQQKLRMSKTIEKPWLQQQKLFSTEA
jgi:hypothetical protein